MTKNRSLYLYGTLAVMAASVLVRWAASGGETVVVAHDTIPNARQRLEIVRRKAATVPGKELILKQVTAELKQREDGLVVAGTAEEARAHLIELLHRTALANGFDTQQGALQLPEPKPLGKNKEYGQVSVGQNFKCGIDQLVNFLSAIANEPEILATDQVFVAPVPDKNKDITVRLIFSGVIPKKLLPVKKGDSF
jgi:hypothetical protein